MSDFMGTKARISSRKKSDITLAATNPGLALVLKKVVRKFKSGTHNSKDQ